MKKKTVGFYGGKFLPIPHMGHVYAMTTASTMVDELHVVISYDEDYERQTYYFLSEIDYVGYEQRLRWWKQITKDMPHVHVHAIKETQTGQFTDWEKGSNLIKKAIGKEIDVVFSSEPSYDPYFKELYPNAKHEVIDHRREIFDISGTQIRREGIFKSWEYVPNLVRPDFVKKVAIVGTESNGKSTLVRNLANLYNTNFVEEIGRTFYDRIGTYETLPSDFAKIAYEHQHAVNEALKDSHHVLFIDTEATVTQNFMDAYEGQRLDVLDEIAKLQGYDLYLFLEPDVEWVDDNTRVFGSEEVRKSLSNRMKERLEGNGIEYETINGNYQERLKKSIDHVSKLLYG